MHNYVFDEIYLIEVRNDNYVSYVN